MAYLASFRIRTRVYNIESIRLMITRWILSLCFSLRFGFTSGVESPTIVKVLIIIGFKDIEEEEMGLKFKEGKILIVAVEDWRQVKWS